jgi:predicted nucleotidyltransferase
METISSLNRLKILEVLKAIKPELEREYHVAEIGLFGSFVRGEEQKASDVDILVEFSRPVGMFKFLELEEFLERKIGKKVDLVSRKALKPYIGRKILNEVVMI